MVKPTIVARVIRVRSPLGTPYFMDEEENIETTCKAIIDNDMAAYDEHYKCDIYAIMTQLLIKEIEKLRLQLAKKEAPPSSLIVNSRKIKI